MRLHPLISREDLLQLLFKPGHGLAKKELAAGLRSVASSMFLHARRLPGTACPVNEQCQFARREGLDDVVDCPKTNGFNGAIHATVGCHHDDTGIGGKYLLSQQICSAAIGKIDVQQDEIEEQVGRKTPG